MTSASEFQRHFEPTNEDHDKIPAAQSLPFVGIPQPNPPIATESDVFQTGPPKAPMLPNVQQNSLGSDKNELLKLLLTLNEGVRALGSRFDSYQTQVDKRFDRINAEMCLLKNRVDMIESHSRRMTMLDEHTRPAPVQPSPASLQNGLTQGQVFGGNQH